MNGEDMSHHVGRITPHEALCGDRNQTDDRSVLRRPRPGSGTLLMTVIRTSCSHHYSSSSALPCGVLSCPVASPLAIAPVLLMGAACAACLPSAAACWSATTASGPPSCSAAAAGGCRGGAAAGVVVRWLASWPSCDIDRGCPPVAAAAVAGGLPAAGGVGELLPGGCAGATGSGAAAAAAAASATAGSVPGGAAAGPGLPAAL